MAVPSGGRGPLAFAQGDQILLGQVCWEGSSARSHFPSGWGEALDSSPGSPPPPPPGPRAVWVSTGSSYSEELLAGRFGLPALGQDLEASTCLEPGGDGPHSSREEVTQ